MEIYFYRFTIANIYSVYQGFSFNRIVYINLKDNENNVDKK